MLRREEFMPYANRRLSELIKDKTDGNVKEFAEEIGMSQQRVNRILVYDKKAAKWAGVSDQVRLACIETYGLEDNYFDSPHGNCVEQQLSEIHEDYTRREKNGLKPHISMSTAAAHSSSFANIVMNKMCETKPTVKLFPSYDMTIDVSGDSMEPKYEKGDLLFIKQVFDIVKPGNPYILDTPDGAVFARIFDRDNKYLCKSINPDYEDFFVEKAVVFGIYKIIGSVRF